VSVDEQGVSLLELLIAIAMITSSVVILSLTFPKASATISNNRQHMLASNLASALIQQVKAQPYALLQPSPQALFTAPAAATCDCSLQDFTVWPATASYTEDGIAYTRQVCVDFVEPVGGGGWNKYCPDGPPITSGTDKGLKNIRVRVTWTSGTNSHFSEAQSMITR
jgi:Tfp pilus assembly protein FimT